MTLRVTTFRLDRRFPSGVVEPVELFCFATVTNKHIGVSGDEGINIAYR